MIRSRTSLFGRHPFLCAMAAGLVAGVVTGRTDRFLNRWVSPEQKLRDRQVREEPAHQHAGPYFAAKIKGRSLSPAEKKRARLAFNLLFGIGWGLIYGGLRRRVPFLGRWRGIPFAIPFFFACDGLIAPLLGVSPRLRRIPWQMNFKEIGNHLAWTAAAETVHRAVGGRR